MNVFSCRMVILLAAMPCAALAETSTSATASLNGATVTAKLDEVTKTVRVEVDGMLFTELVYAGQPKPVLFPIHGPGQAMMVRQWPIREAAPGEEQDHPHHKGMWFTHGEVDGVDFWKEGPKCGKIVVQGLPQVKAVDGTVVLLTQESWQKPDGSEVLTSATTITCGTEAGDRFIDYTITLKAGGRAVLFGDTKEGTMGIRTNPVLNFKGPVAQGTATTSEGKTGAAAWGTHAKWVDYTAPMDGGVLGLACFDHPSNLRHPTTWHARDYGLVAANPFGLHDFQKKPKGTGDYKLQPDAPLTFRYRWLFHRGDTVKARIAERWQAWATAPVK